MAFDQAGEGGLRRRLRFVLRTPEQYPQMAAILGVPEEVLHNYLDNPEYLLSSDLYGQIISHLAELPAHEYAKRGKGTYSYIIVEKPQWTQADIDSLEPPPTVGMVTLFYFNAAYPDEVESDGPSDLDVFSVQQLIDDAIDGDPERLMTVIWYVPYVEYPY